MTELNSPDINHGADQACRKIPPEGLALHLLPWGPGGREGTAPPAGATRRRCRQDPRQQLRRFGTARRRDVEGGGGEGVRTRPPGRGPGWDFQLVAPPPRPSMSSTFNRRGWPGPRASPWADCRDSGPPCLPGANSARLAGTPGNKARGPGTPPRRLPGPSTATEAFVSTGLRSAAGDTVTTWPKAPPTTGRAS